MGNKVQNDTRQELAAKGVRLIDVASERKNPVFTSVQEFVDHLQKYRIKDYYDTEDPYWDLVEIGRAQVGLFDQYAAAMLAVVRNKTKRDHIVNYVAGRIEFAKYAYILGGNETNSIVRYIQEVENDPEYAGMVSVLPLMCGSGKSTAITLLIKETIKRIEKASQIGLKALNDAAASGKPMEEVSLNDIEGLDILEDFDGLLIVTDSKDRLKKIWNPDADNKYITEEDRKFIKKHKDWVITITEENYSDERNQHFSPILCVTTQRYFGWSRDEIQDHLIWGAGKVKHRRPLIIFDEQPYLNEVRDISVKTINDIDTALRCCLYETVNKEDKLWCCDQWDSFRRRFFELLRHYEYDFPGLDTLYYRPEESNITEDDKRFFTFIDKEKAKLRAKHSEAYKDLLAVQTFMNSWGIFNHRNEKPNGEYWNKFTVFIDNRDKVTDLGAKVIVLDGTGDVSPIYSGQNYVHIHDGVSFLRSLSYLTTVLCDFPTSKEDFRNNGKNIVNAVKAYLKDQGHELKDVIFFTYKGKEGRFQAKVNGKPINNVAHFGDIKGKNDFTEKTIFAQVGLNRLQPVHYLAHLLARNKELLDDLASREPGSMYDQIQKLYQDNRFIEFMNDHILADVDQCLFRSAIRNSDNMEYVKYYLFYKQSAYPDLQKLIEKRFHAQLGAHKKTVKENEIWDIANAGTRETILLMRLQDWDGEPIKLKYLLEKAMLNNNSYYTVYRRSKERGTKLAALIDAYKQNAKEMGYPGGWLAKKPVQEEGI